MDAYNQAIIDYNNQAQQIINNSTAALNSQTGNVPTPSLTNGTNNTSTPSYTPPATTPAYTQPATTGSSTTQPNSVIDQYNQQGQQIVANSTAAINNQINGIPSTPSPSGTPGTTTQPNNSIADYYSNQWNQIINSNNPNPMQQGLNDAQQGVNNAQQGVVNATQQAISSTTGSPGATQIQTDAWAEWNTLTAKIQNGTATPADYARAQQLYPLLFGGTTQTPTTDTTGTTGTNGTTDTTGNTTGNTAGTNGQETPQSQNGMTAEQAWAEFQSLIALGTPNAYAQAMALYYSGALNGVPGYTGAATTPGSSTGANTEMSATYPSGNPVVPGVTTEYSPVQMDNIQRINDMYDAQINAQRIALQEQGDQALSDAQANRDKIAATYAKQRNSASVDWERQRRNFLEGANSSGLNTGAGSQADLSMMGMYQRNMNNLGASQAQAEAEADRNIADIRRNTQASINEAVMKNDYQKAAALLDEYKDQYNRAMDRAEALASFGDFSGYAAVYGNDVASKMYQTWIAQNPNIAMALGIMTPQQYAQSTLYAQYPLLALYGGGYGGGYSGGDSYSGTTGDNSDSASSSSGSSGSSGSSYPSAAQLGQMSPASYAAYVNGLVASGQLDGATGQALIQESYAHVH